MTAARIIVISLYDSFSYLSITDSFSFGIFLLQNMVPRSVAVFWQMHKNIDIVYNIEHSAKGKKCC